jgi:hypothetical protein
MEYVKSYFSADASPILFRLVMAFVIGIAFAPFSNGIEYLVFFILLFEALYGYQISMNYTTVRLFNRCGLICATVAGFIIGRFLIKDNDPLNHRSKK